MQRSTFPSRRRGFSFTEVLFAVVILGIGFIMVAAIFPVAIQQSKLTIDETTGASIARGSVGYLEHAMSDTVGGVANSNCPQLQETSAAGTKNSVVQQLSVAATTPQTPLLTALRGSQILPEDPRYAFVSLYRRKGTTPADAESSAQVYIFAVQATVGNIFNPQLDAQTPSASAIENNLMAHEVKVAVAHKISALGDIDLIVFKSNCSGAGATQKNYNVAGINSTGAPVEGGYVVISSDQLATVNQGRMNGQVYKLGARRSDLDADVKSYFPDPQYSDIQAGSAVVFEIDIASPFAVDSGADGIVKKYSSDTSAADDVLGVGFNSALSTQLPTSSVNSTPTSVTMSTVTGTGTAEAFVVGRSFTDPADATNSKGFDGGNMVVGFYTTFVKIN